MREVDETLLNIETAIRRAQRARTTIAKARGDSNFVLALETASSALDVVRRQLFQETYFGDSQQRLV